MPRSFIRAKWLRPGLAVVALAFAAGAAGPDRPAGRLEFDSEEILIDLRGDAVEVTGTYHFRVAGGPVPAQPMLYPTPRIRCSARPARCGSSGGSRTVAGHRSPSRNCRRVACAGGCRPRNPRP